MVLPNSNPDDVQSNMEVATRIFTEYEDFIRSVAYYHIRNEFDVEDFLHDFFIFLVSKPMPPNVKNMQSLLYKITMDRIKDAFRKIDRYHARMNRYAEFNPVRTSTEVRPEQHVIV